MKILEGFSGFLLTGVRTPRSVLYMNTATATSAYGTVREVTISDKGLVHVGTVLLGDVAGMELLGWEFDYLNTLAAKPAFTASAADHTCTALCSTECPLA